MSGTLNTTEYIGSGPGNSGSDSGTDIVAGGDEYLGYDYGTGTATNTTISGGLHYALQDVGADYGTGTAISTTIDVSAYQYVGDDYGTGTATYTTIDGGEQFVGYDYGTGTATSTTISDDGFQYVGVLGGTGAATDTTLDSGGYQFVGANSGTGTATTTTIESGGYQFVGSGATGSATSTTIDSGGGQFVGYDDGIGYATDTTLRGVQYVGDGSGATGSATSTTIDSGGYQYVGFDDGIGTAIDTTIHSGGYQYVGDGFGGVGTAISTYLSGGEQIVSSGGTADDDILYSGGVADILSDGVVNAPVIDGGKLELAAGAVVGSGGIDFAAPSGANGGTLDLTGEGSGLTFGPPISGFAGTGDTAALSDIIDVKGSGEAGDKLSWTQSGGSGTLDVETSAGGFLESLTLEGTYYQNQFMLIPTGSVDQITYDSNAPCYVRGTRILTDRGEVAVEDLAIGDLVVTASGARRPIRWIGRRAYGGRFLVGREAILPIRFAPGSLGEGLPKRELWVSPEHAMFLDGVLIPARALIDGFGVAQASSVESVEYFHVELESHDILIAEGAASESFLDDDSRMMFDNCQEYFARLPNDASPPARYCAPRVESGWRVDAARRKIAARAGRARLESEAGALLGSFRVVENRVEGWALNAAFPDAPVCLDILADGRKIGLALANRPCEEADGHGFAFARMGAGQIEVRRSLDGAALTQLAPRPANAAA